MREMPSSLGLIFFLLFSFTRHVPDQLLLLLVVAMTLCLLPPARRIAELAGPDAVMASRKLTPVQIVLCALGVIVWLLILAAFLFDTSEGS